MPMAGGVLWREREWRGSYFVTSVRFLMAITLPFAAVCLLEFGCVIRVHLLGISLKF